MEGRGCTRIWQWVLVITLLVTLGSLAAGAPIGAAGDIQLVTKVAFALVTDDAEIMIIGHLTENGNALQGTSFTLHANLGDREDKMEHTFEPAVRANGVQVAYILWPNSLVSFTIASKQFVVTDPSVYEGKELEEIAWQVAERSKLAFGYFFPHLPEDPGAASIVFF